LCPDAPPDAEIGACGWQQILKRSGPKSRKETPMKTRAAVAVSAGKPLEIMEVDLEGPKAGEVLVEVKATGICHTDEFTLSGADPEGIFPAILGHEGAGVVVDVGPGVTSVKKGDHVIPLYTPECRQCPSCLSRKTNLCTAIRATQGQGLMPDGTSRFSIGKDKIFHYMGCSTFSNFTVLPEIALAKVNPDAPFDKICYIGCGVTTGIGAVINTAKVEIGATAIVMDVTNGEVLAMASLPTYNPNSTRTLTNEALFNRATLGVYEQGSTFKIFNTATPHARSAAAMVAIRSDSLTRNSCAPRATVRPSANAAATNRAGYSSIIDGASSGGTSIAFSGVWRTIRSATGSPPTRRGCTSLMSAPIILSAVSKPVRVGLSPTLPIMISDPGTIDAATMKKAAEEGSPGTVTSIGLSSASPWMAMTVSPFSSPTSSFAPKPVNIRSV